ncbi:unnamed protein product [Trichogramma brassicae]|uniref:Uncharacterized protein n=1 Tax=Trichogramma brassicae TaxID=86971 RepID=A0A6H5J2S2_9HYME|nr:unnamed protein product [Trichogramma brassicae]
MTSNSQKNLEIFRTKNQRVHRNAVSDWIKIVNYEFPNLITESVGSKYHTIRLRQLVDFVIRTGYRDEPDVDEDGKPLLCRTTPVHRANHRKPEIVGDLFKIYNRFDANYADEHGLTHFHVACRNGCDDVVEKFLEFGVDPNILVPRTGDSPLHLALKHEHKKVVELLLRNGASSNSANEEGLYPLHIICKKYDADELLQQFFKMNEDVQQRVQIDVVDKMGRTPLQWAVAHCKPHMVDMLLDRGANLSNFVFPTESHFDERFRHVKVWFHLKLRLASGALIIVEQLEKRGYELHRSELLLIMTLFAKYEMFKKSANGEKLWYDDEGFENKADYFKFACSMKWDKFTEEHGNACVVHLGELMSRKFFLRRALDPFMELVHYRLPILCCEMIIEQLTNQDVYHICLLVDKSLQEEQKSTDTNEKNKNEISAPTHEIKINNPRPARVTGKNHKDSKKSVKTNKIKCNDQRPESGTGENHKNSEKSVTKNEIKCNDQRPVRAKKVPKRLQDYICETL